MGTTRRLLTSLGLPNGDLHDLPSSAKTFPDGAQYRVEIPSVEGPRVLEEVLNSAASFGITVHRVSQGSGGMMLTSSDLDRMAAVGRGAGIEVSLFAGPRAAWDIGAQVRASAGALLGGKLRGQDQLVFAVEDIRRMASHGIRSVLVADEGLAWVVDRMKETDALPRNLIVKCSVMYGAANPVSIRLAVANGCNTYNIPTDLTLAQISAIRSAVDVPLDVYVEAPDNLGGFVRHYEIPEIVRVGAPVYLKFGLRNAPDIYPSGVHLEPIAIQLAREKVHRATIGLEILRSYFPEATMSSLNAADLGVPAQVATQHSRSSTAVPD